MGSNSLALRVTLKPTSKNSLWSIFVFKSNSTAETVSRSCYIAREVLTEDKDVIYSSLVPAKNVDPNEQNKQHRNQEDRVYVE